MAILILIWLVFLQPLWVVLSISPDGVVVRFRFLGFLIRPSKGKAKAEKEKEKKPKPKRKGTAIQWLQQVPDMLDALKQAVTYLFSRFKLRKLQLEGTVGVDDPMSTGVLSGLIHSVTAVLPHRDGIELDLQTDFLNEKTQLWGEIEGGIRPSSVINSALILLWHLPKREIWRLTRKK